MTASGKKADMATDHVQVCDNVLLPSSKSEAL